MHRFLIASLIIVLFDLSYLTAQQEPYGGNPWPIPGIIEAENYDLGGEGVAYHDTDTLNQGSAYRIDEGVDIQSCSDGGYNVGWMATGEWIEYTVAVQSSGKYLIRLRVATIMTGGTIHIEFKDKDVTDIQTVPNTGDWQQWVWLDIPKVQLDSGVQVMRICIDNTTGYNVSLIQFIQQIDTEYPTISLTSPTDSSEFNIGEQITLAAEAFDADGTIQRVDFFCNGILIGSDTTQPYELVRASDAPGLFTLYAIATDNLGASTISDSVLIFVSLSGLPDSPNFFAEHGFYDSPFNLIISWDSASVIHYTMDGSDPRNNPAAIETPSPATIRIDPTSTQGRSVTPAVVVRAFAMINGVAVTDAGCQTYIFINQVKSQTYPGGDWPIGPVNTKILDYEMDPDIVNDTEHGYGDLIDDALLEIPSICINTDLGNLFDPAIGIYVNPTGRGIEWERPASIELIDPHHREPGFQINAGLRLRGGYSRIPQYYSGQLKHAFRFFFRKEYGKGKLDYPLFGNEGVTKFDCVDLRTAQNYSWSYQYGSSHVCIFVRDLFSRICQRDMGQPYTRSRNYHLYINGMYWGLYQTQERPEASYAESYFGGNKNYYDIVKVDPVGDGVEATDGTLDAFNQLWTSTTKGFQTNASYFKVQGKNADGSTNISSPVLVNIDNLIDYELIIFYAGNFDAPVSAFMGNMRPNNFYAIYNRQGREGFSFFIHDAEHALMDPQYSENSDYGLDRTGPYFTNYQPPSQYFNPQWLHERLSANIEYQVLFSDHIYRHFFNHGALTPQVSQQRLLTLTSDIDTAVIAESARWGDAKVHPPRTKDDDWAPSVLWIINSYFPNRTQVVLQQLKTDKLYPSINPPVMIFNAQEVQDNILDLNAGDTIRIVNNNTSQTGSIIYTLDKTDPRAIGGTVSPSATDAGDEVKLSISSSTVLKARVKNGSTWSALHKIALNTEQDLYGLKITEIHYNPLPDSDISGTEFEFIELKNVGSTSLSLAGAHFINGIEYNFPIETIVHPGNFVVLASNAGMFQKRYGFAPLGEYGLQLDNGGERLVLVNITNDTILTVRYNDKAPWPEEADGGGYSIVAKNINGYGIPDSADYWRASLYIHGSPGRDDLITGIVDAINQTPQVFQLYQNYPNPFNPETKIQYSLEHSGKIRLSIYDLIGREVAILVNEVQEAGGHEVTFRASNLSSGIYFYRLQTTNNVAIKKMILIR